MKKNRDYNLTVEFLNKFEQSALTNAQELIDEANLLYGNKHYARTYFLAVAAIEETGKAHIAYSAKGRNLSDNGLCNKIKQHMDSHSHKITSAFSCWLIKSNNKQKAIDTCLDLIMHLKSGRELSMYTDVKFADAQISEPSTVIRPVAARDTINVAYNCLLHTKEHIENNAPLKTDTYQDKLLCIPSSKISALYNTKDFWEYYIHNLENGDDNYAKHSVRYHEEYYSKNKLFNDEKS